MGSSPSFLSRCSFRIPTIICLSLCLLSKTELFLSRLRNGSPRHVLLPLTPSFFPAQQAGRPPARPGGAVTLPAFPLFRRERVACLGRLVGWPGNCRPRLVSFFFFPVPSRPVVLPSCLRRPSVLGCADRERNDGWTSVHSFPVPLQTPISTRTTRKEGTIGTACSCRLC